MLAVAGLGLLGIAALAFWVERTRLSKVVGGTALSLLLGFLLGNLGAVPANDPAIEGVFTYVVPLLVPLFLMETRLAGLGQALQGMRRAALLAAAGTLSGTLIAYATLDGLGVPTHVPRAAVLGALSSSYTGGAVNFAALVSSTPLKQAPETAAALAAADNLLSTLFLLASALLAKRLNSQVTASPETPTAPKPGSLLAIGLVAIGIVLTNEGLVRAAEQVFAGSGAYLRYLSLAVLSLLVGRLPAPLHARLAGASRLGLLHAFLFFASLGACAKVAAVLQHATWAVPLIGLILAVHVGVLWLAGRLLHVPAAALLLASNAAVLGPTTVPPLARAANAPQLTAAGILVGVLGYALGTPLGLLVYLLCGG